VPRGRHGHAVELELDRVGEHVDEVVVVVPQHREHGGEGLELRQHGRRDHVPGVEHDVGPPEIAVHRTRQER
jgi:hypothetical protein